MTTENHTEVTKMDETTEYRIESTAVDVSKIKVQIVRSLMGDKLSESLEKRLSEELEQASVKVVDQFSSGITDVVLSMLGLRKEWGKLELGSSRTRPAFMNELLLNLSEQEANNLTAYLDEVMKETVQIPDTFFTKSDVRGLSADIRREIKSSHRNAISEYMAGIRQEAYETAKAIAPIIVHELVGMTREEIISEMVMSIITGEKVKLDKNDLDQEKIEKIIKRLDSGVK